MLDLCRVDSLSAFKTKIANIPVLSKEEELVLTMDYYTNRSKESAHKLVMHNLKFVYYTVTHKYSRYQRFAVDLIQEGIIGLITALDKFDPTKGTRFIQYAGWWVKAKINQFLYHNATLVKRFGEDGYVDRQVYTALDNGQEKEHIIERLGITEDRFDVIVDRLCRTELYIDTWEKGNDKPVGSIDLEYTSGACDTATPEEEVVTKLELFNKNKILSKILKEKFNDRELFIIEHRLIEDDMTMQEIGNIYGISRERVRQIEDNVKNRLRTILNKKNCKELYV